jgi:hypothetical protein
MTNTARILVATHEHALPRWPRAHDDGVNFVKRLPQQ